MKRNLPAKPFLWITHDGEALTPAEMKTTHLFYTIRMIFNHLAPPAFRIHGCKRWADVDTMDPKYLTEAVRAMIPELKRRAESEGIPLWMHAQFKQMNDASGQLLRPQMN